MYMPVSVNKSEHSAFVPLRQRTLQIKLKPLWALLQSHSTILFSVVRTIQKLLFTIPINVYISITNVEYIHKLHKAVLFPLQTWSYDACIIQHFFFLLLNRLQKVIYFDLFQLIHFNCYTVLWTEEYLSHLKVRMWKS